MKAQTKMMGLVVLGLMLPSAFAETAPKKEMTRIDFNKMIDANADDKSELEKSVSNKVDKQQAKGAALSDKQKVVDLIDIEVNMKKERPLVDRRFNSDGEPRIDTEFEAKSFVK